MASVIDKDLPVYRIFDWSRPYRHALVTPATRWRVVIEELVTQNNDIILETVLRIRQAGERDAARISDLLQLPEELIRYLVTAANQTGMSAVTGGGIVAKVSSVGWLYRDVATGELWPQLGNQVAPIDIAYTALRGRFKIGTSGRPQWIDALILDSDEHHDFEPSALELARFSKSKESSKRTALISKGESCFVVSPVERDRSGLAVLTSYETPHLSLGRLLEAAQANPLVESWADKIQDTTPNSHESSLAISLNELDTLIDDLNSLGFGSISRSHFESLIDLAIGRWVDHFCKVKQLTGIVSPTSEDARGVADRFPLEPDTTTSWMALHKSDSRRKVLELLVRGQPNSRLMLYDISMITARYHSNMEQLLTEPELLELSKDLVRIGRALLNNCGGDYGQEER